MRRVPFVVIAGIVISTICASFFGCGNGSGGSRITEPPPETLSRYWPNADSSSWTFDYRRYKAAETIIPALVGLAGVPPEQLDYQDLEQRLALDPPDRSTLEFSDSLPFQLAYQGTIRSADGLKQNLVSTDLPALKRDVMEPSPLLARIFLARPDLRTKMIAKGLVSADFGRASWSGRVGLLILDGGYFEKQTQWIGFYGDLRADSSFTIAHTPLLEGTSFRHQLVPDLADDIWEYGWVIGEREVKTPAGEFSDAVGIVYFLDFGMHEIRDEQGNVLARFRSYSIIELFLAPGVGPVYERDIDYLSPPIPELNIRSGVLFGEGTLTGYDLR